mgnify:FL=1
MRRFAQGKIYKEIRLIRICRDCGTQYRPLRFSWHAWTQRCYHCRGKWAKENNAKWWNSLTPERQKEYRKRGYQSWLRWVKKHPEKRNKVALVSYHRRKSDPKNQARCKAYFQRHYQAHRQAKHEYYLARREARKAIPL